MVRFEQGYMENRVDPLQGKGEFKPPSMGGYLREYLEWSKPLVVQLLGGPECLNMSCVTIRPTPQTNPLNSGPKLGFSSPILC